MNRLDRKNIEDIFALTPVQEGMLYHYLKEPESDVYFEQLSLNLVGEINIEIFEQAWNFVIRTNEMLRTIFRWENQENPIQVVLKEHDLKPVCYDVSDEDYNKPENSLREIKVRDRNERFHLREVPFRVTLCKIEKNRYELIVSNHHILYDGWSTGIILKEFFDAYHGLSNGEELVLPVKTKFKEFVKWIRNRDLEKEKNFWIDYLRSFDTLSQLSIKRSRKREEITTTYTKSCQLRFGVDLKGKLEDFVKNYSIPLASFLYTAWGVLLQKYNNSNDVVFGTTVSGRSAKIEGIENMVGLFINTLPLRIQTEYNETTRDLLQRTDQTLRWREVVEHSSLPEIKKYCDMGYREELFDSIVIIENYPLDRGLVQGNRDLSIDSYAMKEMTHYDLTLSIMAFDEIQLQVVYTGDLFADKSIERLCHHFRDIVETIIKDPDQLVADIEIVSEEEKNQLLFDFNNTKAGYPADQEIHELFEEQAGRTPDHIALVGHLHLEGTRGLAPLLSAPLSISYQELNKKSDQLASSLKQKGVQPGTIVAIMVERSIEMVIGILGILKASAAYLPIDPDYPQDRIDYMMEDSCVKILLTSDAINRVPTPSRLSSHPSTLTSLSTLTLTSTCQVSPANLAYVLYTSGSTGAPKGVMVEHRAAVNILAALQQEYPLGETDAYLLKTSYLFDVSVTELFGWYLDGGRLVVLEKGGEKDPVKIMNTVERMRITHINFVPSMFNVFVDELNPRNIGKLSGLKYIFLAGEALLPELVNKSRRLNKAIVLENIYGPTEGTVYSSRYSLFWWGGKGSIPIGKPMQNIRLYILDKDDFLQPMGIPGELCIGGVGLARGYLNNPELTFDRFIYFNRSYRNYKSYISNKLYRTGDLARWLPDGNIEFLGRIDHQVKIRGFRVELGEIENRLLSHEDIKDAVVITREDNGKENDLYAFIVSGKTFAVPELREYLAKELPGYMVPGHFVQLEQIPLTASGKVDRRTLVSSGTVLGTGVWYVSPGSEIEKKLVEIWSEVLGGADHLAIGIHDNFFDIGGNSFSLIRLNSRLKEVFKQDIPMVRLFNYPTIASLARYLSGDRETKASTERRKRIQAGVEIAVIGMSGRFPGAKTIAEFWNNLKNGVESITCLTGEELRQMGVEESLLENSAFVPAKGRLHDIEYFDSLFFGYTPSEAAIMDPQMRIFHECCWEALEKAGYAPGTGEGDIGLYAGASPNPLWEILPLKMGADTGHLHLNARHWEALQLSDKDYLSTRIAYKLNLTGPVVNLQTACSTSLSAVILACQGLVSGTCDMALAGGVSVTLYDQVGYLYQEGAIMSQDGHCKAFDDAATGTVGGNGAGVVVLKRLADAAADGDNITAVIKGFAINNDGQNKAGFTAPGVEGQASVIRDAQRMAGVGPGTIGYVETHGTGTRLGDSIEIEALKQAFDPERVNKRNYCALGSVKANIGHLDAAAGIAGFIKTVLVLMHRSIPPGLHFETPNPGIDFENSPFYINRTLKEWKSTEYPLRAGISSFGIGGTNAHVVLEDYPEGTRGLALLPVAPLPEEHSSREYQLILLSAKTPTALDKMTENLAEYLKNNFLNPGNHENPTNPGPTLADAAYTLQTGRKAFSHRRMLVCKDNREAIGILASTSLNHLEGAGQVKTFQTQTENPFIVFMFPGQGAQYVNMGRELYEKEPVFREEMNRCFGILKPLMGHDLKEILYPFYRSNGDNRSNRSYKSYTSYINQTKVTQPVIFAFEYALARLLMLWGIQPQAMIGHSIGEYTAACLSGVFSLEDALKLVTLRGKLMQGVPGGSMLSVPLPEEELTPLLDEELSLAAVNSTSHCVVSGSHETVEAFARRLKDKGFSSRRLHTSHAFHSKMMEPVLKKFEKTINDLHIKLNPARIPFISNVTGHRITDEETVNPHYWAVHLRKTVRFADGLAQLFKIDGRVFVEVGPGQVLSTFTRQYHHKSENSSQSTLVTNLVPHPQEDVPGEGYLLTKLGELWLYGVKIHWPGFYLEEKRSRIALPTYPFEGKRFPVPVDAVRGSFKEGVAMQRKPHLEDWFYIPAWEQLILPPPPSLGCLKSFNWLIFVDQGGLGDKLVNQLESVGPDVITVRIGQGFSKVRNYVYTINPHNSGDYDDLFLELKKLKRVPGRIVHLWGVTGEGGKEAGFEALNRTQDFGLYSLLNIVQAAARQQITGEIQVEIVVNGIHEVTGEELIQPEKATVLGAVKVIPLEYRNIKCRCLDIVKPVNGIESETKLLHRLLTEFAYTVDSTGNIVALRGNYRWLQRMKPLKLENPQPENQRLKQGGVYLVTGGLGGIGLTLAEHLAACCKAKLVLVGRSSFPQKKQWKEWLANHHENDNISSKILKLRQIEASGAEIMVASANAADARQMEKVIADALERFGKINGVLHAAGAVDDNGIIQGRTKEMTEQVMAAKVKGTRVLDHLLKDMEPDFIALFSSLGNITWGLNFGQVGYNAANEFLDAFAYFKNTRDGIFTVSINWPAWKQVGMAERARKQDIPGYEAILENALLPAEGKEVFSRILESTLPRLAVSPVDLPDLLQQYKEVADGVLQEVVSPRYPRPQLSTHYAPPRNEIQQALVNIFEEFFGINPIGIRDNFFELGGDSLKAMGVSAKIHKELNVEVPLAEFFSRPTVEALARYISDKTGKMLYSSIEPTEQKDYYALSSAQKRLYFLQQMDLESSSYNMTMVMPLNGAGKDINKEGLETTIRKLISRHESLRTSFLMMGEEPVQRIHNEVEFDIEYYDLQVTGADDRCRWEGSGNTEGTGGLAPLPMELAANTLNKFIRPFDLSQAPLVRSGLIRLLDRSYTWIVDMHHIICDGTSSMVLVEDFTSLYNGEQLESLRLQYKDFSNWQNRLFSSGKIISQEKYWLELYCDAGHIPRLPLPTDFKRPQVFTFAGGRYVFNLDREDVPGFRELALRHSATLYMNILAALNTLFYRYTGQLDIIIGSGTAGRRHSDLQGIIGMFVNTLAMRNYPDGEKTYEFFLQEVTANSIRAFDNQDVQFEELVDKLDLERNPSKNPLFDISMVVQNFRKPGERGKRREKIGREEILPLGDENLFNLDYMNTTSKFDMTFYISEPGQEVSIMIEYYTGIFKEETIFQIARHFKNIVKAVIKEPCQRLKDIEIISPAEKRMVLYDFNAVSRGYPLEKSIHGRIAEQVEKTPDNVALVYEDYALTYQELDERANQVAGYLYKKGIRPEQAVGILLDKGIEIVVALLGTLKAGGAYIPMESSFPPERQKHIIIDSHIGVVLSEKSQIRDLNRLQWECDCFYSYLCLDSNDVYAEEEVEKNELMNRELWEHVGETAADEIAGGGWVSSYTGEPMSKQEMDEYGDNVLKKLTPLIHEETRVLEIGTASGITMYRIAPKVDMYYGTDLSSVIIDKNKERVKEEGRQNIKLACLAAEEIDKIEEKDFDLIIINSVIQSFHGHNYLGQVMVKCIGLLGDRGYLFIGDIMDQDLKDMLETDMKAFQQAHQDKNYSTKTDFSAELFVSRGFWEDLAARLPVIEAVDFSGKIHTIANELTRYRYDALLTVNKGLGTGRQRIKQRNKYQEDLRSLAVVGAGDSHLVSTQVPPNHLAYIIYTSGTTGQPKGVMVEHSQVNNCLYWMQEKFNLNSTDVVLHRTNLTFDPSVWEIFWPLVIGASVKVIRPDQRKDAEYLIQLMEQDEGGSITLMYCPSSLVTGMTYLLSSGAGKQKLKVPWLIIGAEPIRMEVVKEFYTYFFGMIVNTYGPTEGTINNTYYDLAANDTRPVVPLGKPVSNNFIYILSHDMRPIPLFTAGEIYIGGYSVGRGYLNQPELTYEKFKIINYKLKIKNGSGALRADLNAFGEGEAHELPRIGATSNQKFLQGGPGGTVFTKRVPPGRRRQKIYSTGDMARWLIDGNVEFLGRVDQQVKIRGYRIELGEIEKRLLQHDKIKEGVVVLHDGKHRKDAGSERFLCAYIVPGDFASGIDSGELRRYITVFLPEYMVPSYFVRIPRIPLTPGGKVDRKALPVPKEEVTVDENYVPPRDQLEKRLVVIWAEVLNRWGQGLIGLDDNFFALGGHSLKVTILTARIHKELNVKVPMAEVFKRQTIRGLAGFIRETAKDEYVRIEPVEKKEFYALSSAQKRLYVLQQMGTNNIGYNELSVLELVGELDRESFEETFKKLIKRHESLRTSFTLIEYEPVQNIHEEVEFEIEYYRAERKAQSAERKEEHHALWAMRYASIIKDFIRPFDLTQAPLLRVGLIKLLHTPTALCGHPSQEGKEDKYLLMLDIHHIITDGISQGILIKDFMALYEGVNLPEPQIQYKDFSGWQIREKEKESIKKPEPYWLKEFRDEIPVLNLPVDFERPPIQSFEGNTVDFILDLEETRALNKLASKGDATLFMILLAIYNIFLFKISGQEDIIIGTPVSGRTHADLGQIIGMFVNTLALRHFPNGEKPFKDFLEEVKNNTLKAFENQDYHFEDLIEKVEVNRDTGRNPLFDVMFTLQNLEIPTLEIPGLTLKPLTYETGTSKFDITLTGFETGQKLLFTIEYSTKLFKQETIQGFVNYFNNIVSAVLAAPGKKIEEIEIISQEERERILIDFNDTAREYPGNKTIHRLFEEQVERIPDNTALVGQSSERKAQSIGRNKECHAPCAMRCALTYRELSEKSDQLAHLLIEKGVQTDRIVGIMVERSLEMIIGILGILKSDGAYLPIDPDSPPDRIEYMLADSNVGVLVTTPKFQVKVKAAVEENDRQPRLPLQFVSIKTDHAFASEPSPSTLTSTCQVSPTNLVYIIYTSGSTGKPKGVLITHRNICPLLHWGFHHYGIGPNARTLQNLSYFFDWSVWEIFITLTSGGGLYIAPSVVIHNPDVTMDFIKTHAVTVLHITPTQFQYLLKAAGDLQTLDYLFIGAEKLTVDVVRRGYDLVREDCRVFNMYGPTEATIISTALEIQRGDEILYKELSSVPIGKPSDNTFLLVLDKSFNICPVRIAGELYIGGDGVSRGYLNNPKLTSQKFIDIEVKVNKNKKVPGKKNYMSFEGTRGLAPLLSGKNPMQSCSHASMPSPHHPNTPIPHSPYSPYSPTYRTGDLAKWLPDGNIEFLGRIDHQVKIRGFRVELGEIESRLLSHSDIKETVVLAPRDEGGNIFLCAYIVPNKELIVSELREYLAEALPGYMIPSYFVQVEKIPLNPNGKIDRKALPEPEIKKGEDYVAPRNALEGKLVEIWREVLGPGISVGIEDNFFELGGHSLKGTVLISRIHREFNTGLLLVDLFKFPTVRRLARFLREKGSRDTVDKFIAVEPVPKQEYYALSPAQKRLYVMQQMDVASTTYNMLMVVRLKGQLENEKLEFIFKTLIARHESFRTSFVPYGKQTVQKIHHEVEFEMDYYDLQVTGAGDRSRCEDESDIASSSIKNFIRPFDLSYAPLLRVGLIKLPHTPAALRSHPSQEGKEHTYILMVDMHHIISDGVTLEIFINEFMALYRGENLLQLRLQYKDFSCWKNHLLQSGVLRKQEEFWLNRFKGKLPELNMPLDFPRPRNRGSEGDTRCIRMDEELLVRVKKHTRRAGTTIYQFLLTVYNVLLYKYTGQTDIIVGSPVSGRRHADLEGIVGVFVNMVAIRNYPGPGKTFAEFLEEVKTNSLAAYENQDYPFDELVNQLGLQGKPGRNPVFDVGFLYNALETRKIQDPHLKITPYEVRHRVSRFDMLMGIWEDSDGIGIRLEYSTQLFKSTGIDGFLKHYMDILGQVTENVKIKLEDIEIETGLKAITSKKPEIHFGF